MSTTSKDDLYFFRQAAFEAVLRKEGLIRPTARAIERRQDSGPLPLSPAQRRLWFFNQLEPGNPVYNECFAIRLTGTIHLKALERAINETVRRHEVLRTTFDTLDEQPVQI